MKNIPFIIFVILSSVLNQISAQTNCSFWGTNDVENQYHVYSDIANVRAYPDINSEIIFKLSVGQELIKLPIEEVSTEINGIDGQWYFIKTKGEKSREGWIWSGTLSARLVQQGNTKFVFGSEINTANTCNVSIKAIENGKVIHKLEITDYYDVALNDVRIIDSVRMDNVESIVHVSLTFCGCNHCSDNEFYFAWNSQQKKLVKLMETISYLESSECLYIPTENNKGVYNILVVITEKGIGESTYDPQRGSRIWEKYEIKSKLFRWNGKRLVEIKATK